MVSKIASNALQVFTRIPISVGLRPNEKPSVIPLGPFNFSQSTEYNVNLTLPQARGIISIIQSIYIDNSDNPFPLAITFEMSGHSIVCPSFSQGYYPTFSPENTKFKVTCTGSVDVTSVIYVSNIPLDPASWGVVTKDNAGPCGYQQLDATALATSQSLTIPTNAKYALMIAEVNTVRWRDDGTAPTAAIGMPLAASAGLYYTANLRAFKVISAGAGAIFNVSYYG